MGALSTATLQWNGHASVTSVTECSLLKDEKEPSTTNLKHRRLFLPQLRSVFMINPSERDQKWQSCESSKVKTTAEQDEHKGSSHIGQKTSDDPRELWGNGLWTEEGRFGSFASCYICYISFFSHRKYSLPNVFVFVGLSPSVPHNSEKGDGSQREFDAIGLLSYFSFQDWHYMNTISP